jgi:hypothetical protein
MSRTLLLGQSTKGKRTYSAARTAKTNSIKTRSSMQNKGHKAPEDHRDQFVLS